MLQRRQNSSEKNPCDTYHLNLVGGELPHDLGGLAAALLVLDQRVVALQGDGGLDLAAVGVSWSKGSPSLKLMVEVLKDDVLVRVYLSPSTVRCTTGLTALPTCLVTKLTPATAQGRH